ncbi:hypothetical protein G6038_25635 [Rhodococcus sp. 14C212]|uniref:hypothetical protein n=1 Tax=Rhodococcus sp. 14C212 TaxID=2711209 RepID=UPI0013ECF8B3|nr:hypothetical protein [Rhodococcus sp. 14C212]NGP08790.1 hypothetical protein [Rhodococcus sp. 14C212]
MASPPPGSPQRCWVVGSTSRRGVSSTATTRGGGFLFSVVPSVALIPILVLLLLLSAVKVWLIVVALTG